MNQLVHQRLVWQPSANKKSGWKVAGKKEGFHLPNSVTEDVCGRPLAPYYSVKQLVCIGKKKGRKGISRKARKQWRLIARW